jgi:hypothetical protein
MPSWSKLSQLSTTLPSEKRKIPIFVTVLCLPVGDAPQIRPGASPKLRIFAHHNWYICPVLRRRTGRGSLVMP